ncbi:MAG: phosphoribosylpyrophosphate synthetase [Nitrospirae bacterium CG_4_10_14_3_um_filter_44_29]|nr:ribose-phosphate pyrophosphokinase [Nitrospirota bacterium]OIO30326.1 MAG: phosphoribosylpyrophosphate synthetase [Nitrospirae bacterium CG1_02_44_142]PIP69386.1 MAG: phosphoribosylpyrophosphate synthetase [Nitrospirae bacterium CG22_combo_CG10-13_8_21_14_all_44_11]PIV41440.1 MAG: phosphoribosylpyrophosphate synthetase [Nitrospirae bacterium CG02_land_8_20_14_3_00_44_33]PIV65842.1 MAG: phosphoribosylpyrophosphate synthetase [Nitrospirae bacterium CG01_land_8_20_14_3_00_44_22]PIW89229.1 MAG:
MPNGIRLLTGNSNRKLAGEVAEYLGISVCDTLITTFSDGEIMVQINENVRGSDIFALQSTCTPVNDNILELLLLIDALKRASAGRITAVIPYYGYARQDRKVQPRVPISSKLVADLITVAGANRVLTVDLHAGQIQGFFNIPVDHLYASPVLLDYIKKSNIKDIVIVSPDAGGVERARAFAKRLSASLAIIDKRRERANESQVMNVIGDVKGGNTIILDDMIDTAGTITQAALALKEKGAKRVLAACTHAVLSGPAIDRINNSVIEELIVTNTIQLDSKQKKCKKLTVLSIAPLLAEAIKRIHEESSISSLFV